MYFVLLFQNREICAQDVQEDLSSLRRDLDRVEVIVQELDLDVTDLKSVCSYEDVLARYQRLIVDVDRWVAVLDTATVKRKQFDVR